MKKSNFYIASVKRVQYFTFPVVVESKVSSEDVYTELSDNFSLEGHVENNCQWEDCNIELMDLQIARDDGDLSSHFKKHRFISDAVVVFLGKDKNSNTCINSDVYDFEIHKNLIF